MKIIFLCGSLESGKDGVGDYTRRLANELIKQGHQCGIIAIMDKGVKEIIEENQHGEYVKIPVLRLPFNKGFVLNCKEAKNWLDRFNPEWISLQYVSFSFHPKGFPFGFGEAINQLTKSRKLHVMFHELWVGMDKDASLKMQMWGKLQRTIINSFIKNVKPLAIHTQTKLYQQQLLKSGISVNILPLFGNIPLMNDFREVNNLESVQSKKMFTIVIFGSIHYGAPIEAFSNSVSKHALSTNLDIEIVFIGRCGEEIKEWIAICKKKKIKIKVLGELVSPKISEVLSRANLGVTTTPFLLAEKSGTVAAMHEHELPVLCVSRLWEVEGLPEDCTPFGVQFFKGDDLSHYIVAKKGKLLNNSISNISNQFLNSLFKFK
jgi:hypothetical protein